MAAVCILTNAVVMMELAIDFMNTMPKGRPKSQKPRSIVLQIRLTKSEYENLWIEYSIEAGAERQKGNSLSLWARNVLITRRRHEAVKKEGE